MQKTLVQVELGLMKNEYRVSGSWIDEKIVT